MQYLLIILSLIQPVLTLPLSFIVAIRKNSKAIPVFCIALAFATITYTLQPVDIYDLYHHYQRIENLAGLPLAEIIKDSKPGYRLFDIYAWLINLLGLPKEFFSASIVFISYYLVLSVFNGLKLKYLQNSSPLIIACYLIIFWLSIGYIGLSSGLRNPFSTIILFYSCYKLVFQKKLMIFFMGSIIAFFIHPFAIAPLIFIVASVLLSYWSKNAKWLIYIGFILTFISRIIEIVIDYIIRIFSNTAFFNVDYFEDDNRINDGTLSSLGFSGFLVGILIPKIPLFLAQIYLISIKTKAFDTIYLLLAMLSIYLGLFISFKTVYSRMGVFFLLVFALYIVLERSLISNKRYYMFLVVYILSLIIYSFAFIYSYRPYLLTGLFSAIFKPFLFIVFKL